MTDDTILELVTVTDAARRIGVCSATLKRRIARAGIVPDAVLIEGSKQLRSPLFVEPRLNQLKKLVEREIL
jgi:hypothetical protein